MRLTLAVFLVALSLAATSGCSDDASASCEGGCETGQICVSTGGVLFGDSICVEDGTYVPDASSADAGDDASGDTGNGDTGTCGDPPDLCAAAGLECGQATVTNGCGEEVSLRCGNCGAGTCVTNLCDCGPGFEYDRDAGCRDINECDDSSACPAPATCENAPGTYRCTCPAGFVDGARMGSCRDLDECATGVANCDVVAGCTNTPGSYACGACPGGYVDLNGDSSQCADIDECATGTDDCAVGVVCNNAPGSWVCGGCPAGFVDTNGDGTQCTDIDECATSTDDCDPLAGCTNTVGGFQCGSCPLGYNNTNFDGTLCTDVDECATGLEDCDAQVTCSNTPGSFTCGACPAGFVDPAGDGRLCSDIDECTTGSDDCEVTASCSNIPGAFDCTCTTGYVGDGHITGTGCADVDECADGTDGCDQAATCSNTDGGYTCSCPNGYTDTNGDGTACACALTEATETTCGDGLDNDCDGAFDCADTDCHGSVACSTVAQVAHVEVELSGTQADVEVDLPVSFDIGQTVPFVTARHDSSMDDHLTALVVDVYLVAPDRVRIERGDAAGTLEVGIDLVEFKPGIAVQSGTYAIDFGDLEHTVTLPQAVNPAASFLTFFGQAEGDNTTDEKDELMVAGRLTGPGSLSFAREFGTAVRLSGHWWVVEATAGQFAVQHLFNSTGAATGTWPIATVDQTRTLILHSNSTSHDTDDGAVTHLACRLQSGGDLIGFARWSGADTVDVAVQVVEFQGVELVQRGLLNLNANQSLSSNPLGASIDPARSMVFHGGLGVAGASFTNATSSNSSHRGFGLLRLTNGGTRVEMERGPTSGSGVLNMEYQAVRW